MLIIDFFHPELTASEQTALKTVFDIRNQFEGRADGPYSVAATPVASVPPPPSVPLPSFFDNVRKMVTGAK